MALFSTYVPVESPWLITPFPPFGESRGVEPLWAGDINPIIKETKVTVKEPRLRYTVHRKSHLTLKPENTVCYTKIAY